MKSIRTQFLTATALLGVLAVTPVCAKGTNELAPAGVSTNAPS